VLRGGDGVGGGRVDDEAPVLGGGGEVDVVDPDPRAADDAEPTPGRLEDVASDLGPGPDDERVAEGDLGAEVLGGEAVGAVDVGELPQQGEARGAELLGDEDRGLPRDGSRGGGVGGGGRRRGGRGRDRGRGEARRALGVGVGLAGRRRRSAGSEAVRFEGTGKKRGGARRRRTEEKKAWEAGGGTWRRGGVRYGNDYDNIWVFLGVGFARSCLYINQPDENYHHSPTIYIFAVYFLARSLRSKM
jgi:hypothetical protein